MRFDDGQRGERTVAVLFVQPRGAFEQAAVQIKHVARISLAAGRALEHQRHLAIGHGMLGEVVVNNQRVHAIVHEPFAHGGPREWRQILIGGGVGS